jgi:hypothetical protein
MREIASHMPRPNSLGVWLTGGPWDGKQVWVLDPLAELIQVNGPRDGDQTVWITHLYAKRGSRYEFVTTEAIPIGTVC